MQVRNHKVNIVKQKPERAKIKHLGDSSLI